MCLSACRSLVSLNDNLVSNSLTHLHSLLLDKHLIVKPSPEFGDLRSLGFVLDVTVPHFCEGFSLFAVVIRSGKVLPHREIYALFSGRDPRKSVMAGLVGLSSILGLPL